MAYRWDDFALDVAARRLVGSSGALHLEPQVFDVLALLVAQRDRVLSKAEILDEVWGDQFVSESALSTRIKQVRQCLGDDGRTQKYIRTVHGHGYQFVGDIVSSRSPGTPADVPARAAPTTLNLAVDIAVDDEYPFVGRADELGAIEAVLQSGAVANGKIFIGGAPGSGKSRLAIELLKSASEQGTTVCAGRCEANVTSSLQPVRDAFAQLAANNPQELAAWSHGIEGQLLSLIPSLVDLLPYEPVRVDAYAGIDVFLTVFERVAATVPVILLVDDLQWSDEPTRAFLAKMHRRMRGQSITTVGTYRSARSDLPVEVHAWIRRECRSPAALRITLENLGEEAALQLIAAVMGSPATAESRELVAATAGHGLFLTESLRDLQLGQDAASSVNELIARRLERQDPEVQQIVRAGAVLGAEFSFPVAAAVAELPLNRALAAVDTAIDAELLHETTSASRFRFSHQLVPAAIVESMTRSSKASFHAACAAALRDHDADPVEVAFHSLAAVPLIPLEEAIEQGRSAALLAQEANQFDRAHRMLEAILLAEPQLRIRAEVLLAIGQILNRQGTPALAIDSLEQVTDIARKNRWPDLFLAAAIAHWNRSPFRKPSDTSTLKLLAEADELLGNDASIDKARVIAKTSVFTIFRRPLADRVKQINRALSMAADATDEVQLELLEWQHITYSCPAGSTKLDSLDAELERLRSRSDTYFTDAAAPETAALMHGRGAELRRITRADDERMKAQPIAEWRDLATRSTLAAFDGDIAEARALCDGAAEIGEAYWGESSFALHGFGQFFLDLVSDQWTHSLPLLEMLAEFSGANIFDGALIAAVHACGELDKAHSLRERLDLGSLPGMGEHILGGNGLVGLAQAAVRLEDDELAAAVESALAPFEHLMMGVPWSCSLAAADALADLAVLRGDEDAASRLAGIARSLYDQLGAPYLSLRLDALNHESIQPST